MARPGSQECESGTQFASGDRRARGRGVRCMPSAAAAFAAPQRRDATRRNRFSGSAASGPRRRDSPAAPICAGADGRVFSCRRPRAGHARAGLGKAPAVADRQRPPRVALHDHAQRPRQSACARAARRRQRVDRCRSRQSRLAAPGPGESTRARRAAGAPAAHGPALAQHTSRKPGLIRDHETTVEAGLGKRCDGRDAHLDGSPTTPPVAAREGFAAASVTTRPLPSPRRTSTSA